MSHPFQGTWYSDERYSQYEIDVDVLRRKIAAKQIVLCKRDNQFVEIWYLGTLFASPPDFNARISLLPLEMQQFILKNHE
jgi:hypothetical protein